MLVYLCFILKLRNHNTQTIRKQIAFLSSLQSNSKVKLRGLQLYQNQLISLQHIPLTTSIWFMQTDDHQSWESDNSSSNQLENIVKIQEGAALAKASPKQEKKLRNTQTITDFIFPRDRWRYTRITSIETFKTNINEQKQKYKLIIGLHFAQYSHRYRFYERLKLHDVYVFRIFLRCAKCNNRLIMKLQRIKEEKFYTLVYFNPTHSHNEKENFQEIFANQVSNMNPEMPMLGFKKYLLNKYSNLNDGLFYYMLKKIQKQNAMRPDLQLLNLSIANLYKDKNSTYHSLDIDEEPIHKKETVYNHGLYFIMWLSPNMKQAYMKSGHRLYFIVFELPPFVDPDTQKKKEWLMVCFSGLNYQIGYEPFAYALIENRGNKEEDIKKIFIKLFNIMNNKKPLVLFTPHDQFYESLVKLLRDEEIFNGLHLLDPIIFLDQVKKQTEDIALFNHIKTLIRCSSWQNFYENVQLFMKEIPPTSISRKWLNRITRNAHKICFNLVNTDIQIGVFYLYSANKYMVAKIEEIMFIVHARYRRHDYQLFGNFFLFFAKERLRSDDEKLKSSYDFLNLYEHWKLQKYVGFSEIEKIRRLVNKYVLNVLLHQFGKILAFDLIDRPIQKEEPSQVRVFDILDKNTRTHWIVAAVPTYTENLEFDKFIWRCNCLFSIKTGVPCGHQIKVCLLTRTSILSQFRKGLIKPKKENPLNKKSGRPRLTRRNTEK